MATKSFGVHRYKTNLFALFMYKTFLINFTPKSLRLYPSPQRKEALLGMPSLFTFDLPGTCEGTTHHNASKTLLEVKGVHMLRFINIVPLT